MSAGWHIRARMSEAKPEERFEMAKSYLDECREKLARAQTEFIEAERIYNDASREYMGDFAKAILGKR